MIYDHDQPYGTQKLMIQNKGRHAMYYGDADQTYDCYNVHQVHTFLMSISDVSNLSVVYKGVHKGKPVAIKTLREAKNMDDFLVEASSMT